MKKRKYLKTGMAMLLIVSMFLTACSDGDRTGNGSATIEGSRLGGTGNTSKKTSQYAILVVNEKGEAISGATVTLDGVKKTTGNTGHATFNRPAKSKVKLVVTCKGYYAKEIPNHEIRDENSCVQVVIRSYELSKHRLKEAIYSNNKGVSLKVDILKECKMIYKNDAYSNFSIETSVTENKENVSRYELHQETGKSDKLIATSKDGKFERLNQKDFNTGVGIYVMVWDKKNHHTSTSLYLEVGEDPNANTATSLSLGEGIEFEVSDKVPIFGGNKMKLDVPELPITYKTGINDDGESYARMGFNIKEETMNDKEKMDEYKKCLDSIRHAKQYASDYKSIMKSIKRHQKKEGLMSISKFDKGVDFSATGYVEAGYDSAGVISKGTGYLCFTLEGSAEFGWQFVVWIVPVTVNVKGEVTADFAGTVCYNFQKNEFEDAEIALVIKPGLEVSAGPGFENLSAGIYGSAALETKLVIASFKEKKGFDYVDLISSLGVYAKIGVFDPKMDFWSGTINLWKRLDKDKYKKASKKNILSKNNVGKNLWRSLYDMSNYSPIKKADNISAKNVTNVESDLKHSILCADINEGARPIMEANGSGALAMFCAQQKLGKADYTYSKLCYSVYKDGAWSDSNALDSEICNQMNPVMYRSGDSVYIVYQESKYDFTRFDKFEEKTKEEKLDLMRSFWKSVDLRVKRYDFSTNTFTDLGTIKTSNSYDYNASLYMYNGTLYVYWANNKKGDVFGTDAATDNDIYATSYVDGAWTSVNAIKNNVKNISNLEIGKYNGVLACVYTVDEDGDISTGEDLNTYLYKEGKAEKIRTGVIKQLQFKKIPGNTEESFLVSDSKGLYSYSNGKWEPVLENTASYDDKYSITDNAVYFEVQSENDSELFGCYSLKDGALSEPVQITQEGNWLRETAICTSGGNELVMGMEDIFENGSKRHTNLVSYQIGRYYDLTLDEAYIDYENTFDYGTMPVHIVVKNTGNLTIPGEKFVIKDGKGTVLPIQNADYSQEIKPGESVDMEISVTTTEQVSFSEWKLEGSIENPEESEEKTVYEERTMDDNTYKIKTGYSDFIVKSTLCNAGAYSYLIVEVKNNGTVEGSTTLKVLDANSVNKEFCSENTGNIAVGSTKLYKININSKWADSKGKVAMLIKAGETENEIYTYNNFSYEYATLNYGKYNIKYVLNGGKNHTSNPSSYLTTQQIDLKNPSRNGYTFVGWYTTPGFDADTQCVRIATGSAGDTTLYAKWSKNSKNKTVKKTTKKKIGKVKIKSVNSKKKGKVSITWSKIKGAKGYKLQYSRSRKFNKKKTKIRYCKKTKISIKKLKKGKTYYIRVRAYRKKSGKKIYGKWSKVKRVKIKK